MRVIHSALHARHDGGMELHRGLVPCFEAPARAEPILQAVQRAGLEVSEPREFPVEVLGGVHDAAFVEFLRTAHPEWPGAGKDGPGVEGAYSAGWMFWFRRKRFPGS